eukprot:TRINITY_DN5576_c0_g1_i6.p1 TRINITY_DN5576_c0_g1~~TRINITY_DN5576_c0_g1_i6.p1  ORF type:complete len:314 (+),score=36.33 TRINITY_DN5576_c0_g1_i6:63-1004(+)
MCIRDRYMGTRRTRQYVSINGRHNITITKLFFNGNTTTQIDTNPWDVPKPLHGSDISGFNPNLRGVDTLTFYSQELYRALKAKAVVESYTYNDIVTKRFVLDESTFSTCPKLPENCDYFQYEGEGLLNMTSVLDVPVFVSKGHLLDVEDSWKQTVNIKDSLGSEITPLSEFDDNFFDVEPYSGLTFGAKEVYQYNYLLTGDEIFNVTNPTIIPIMLVKHSFNFSATTIQYHFDLMKSTLKYHYFMILAGCVLGVIFLVISMLIFIRIFVLRIQKGDRVHGSESTRRLVQDAQITYVHIIERHQVPLVRLVSSQ